MRTLLCIIGCLILAIPQAAWAACQSTYPLQTLARDLGIMQSSLRNLDETAFRDAGTRLKQGMTCMEAPAPAPVYATAYRLLGALYHLEGDVEQSEAWFRTALELDPGFAWDVRDFDVGHPIRISFEGLSSGLDTTPVRVEGKKVRQPKTGRLLIDGRPLMEPEATLGRPHMVQQISGDNKVIETWVFDGNSFPEQVVKPDFEQESGGPALVIGDEPAKDKGKGKTKRNGDVPEPVVQATTNPVDDVVMVERIRPPMKTPLLLLGGAGLVAGGGTYAASYMMHQRFLETTTTDEANQLRTTTNALVMASGGIAVVGLGLGYWGVLLDGGYGVGIHGRF